MRRNVERNVDRTVQRARAYWYEDGLAEIAGGCAFILVGLLFLVEILAPPGSLPAGFTAVVLPLLLFASFYVARWAIGAVKARLTYPRAGHAAYRRAVGSRRWVATVVAAAGMGALVAIVLVLWPVSRSWIPVLQGLVAGAFLLYTGHALRLVRFYVLAALSVLFGLVSVPAHLGDTAGSAAFFGAMGAALLVSGVVTLWNYLGRVRSSGRG